MTLVRLAIRTCVAQESTKPHREIGKPLPRYAEPVMGNVSLPDGS